MKYAPNTAKIAALHPKFAPLAQSFIEDAEGALGITLCIVQGMRTFAQQQAIYDQGRTTPGNVVTKAKPGESYHNYGLAVDITPVVTSGPEQKFGTHLDWEYDFFKLVPFAEKYGITWGGLFPSPDRDHFENKFGHNWRDLLTLHNASSFIPGTEFVNF
jgi:hypothetical protein